MERLGPVAVAVGPQVVHAHAEEEGVDEIGEGLHGHGLQELGVLAGDAVHQVPGLSALHCQVGHGRVAAEGHDMAVEQQLLVRAAAVEQNFSQLLVAVPLPTQPARRDPERRRSRARRPPAQHAPALCRLTEAPRRSKASPRPDGPACRRSPTASAPAHPAATRRWPPSRLQGDAC